MPTAKRAASTRTPKSRSAQPASARRAQSKKMTRPSEGESAPSTAPSTKHARALALLRSTEGITVPDLAKALSWQSHSVRGFLAGTVKKKLKLDLRTHRVDGEITRYSIVG